MDSEATQRPAPSGMVMASIDSERDGERLIIADVSRDDAWISMPKGAAPTLSTWR